MGKTDGYENTMSLGDKGKMGLFRIFRVFCVVVSLSNCGQASAPLSLTATLRLAARPRLAVRLGQMALL